MWGYSPHTPGNAARCIAIFAKRVLIIVVKCDINSIARFFLDRFVLVIISGKLERLLNVVIVGQHATIVFPYYIPYARIILANFPV